MAKQKVIVLYGGKSTEHEISRRSARFVFNHIDASKYEIIPVGITKDGRWCLQDLSDISKDAENPVPLDEQAPATDLLDLGKSHVEGSPIIVFPMLHGTYGEDGCTQGFLELKSFAYVGPGVLGSSIAMDKVIAKKLVALAGVPVVPSVDFLEEDWQSNKVALLQEMENKLSFPMYVKPSNLGSSVGISKVSSKAELETAIEEALRFDHKILVETGISAREIEFAALGEYSPKISSPGEVEASAGFYSYESKYEDPHASEVKVPAPMDQQLAEKGKILAAKAFKALNLYGLSRIDFFLDRDSNEYYFNEANTLPGFTSISQYPLLWKHEGLSEQALIDQLIDTAVRRWERQSKLKRSYTDG